MKTEKLSSENVNANGVNPLLATGHFKCSDCQHKKRYTTGRDEYPALTTIEYCSKGHWEGGDPEPEPNQDFTVWDNCKDFLPCC